MTYHYICSNCSKYLEGKVNIKAEDKDQVSFYKKLKCKKCGTVNKHTVTIEPQVKYKRG